MDQIEDGLRRSGSVALLVGRDGIGPWEMQQTQAALIRASREPARGHPCAAFGC